MTDSIEDLSKRKCVPCEGGTPALSKERASEMLMGFSDWSLAEDGKCIRTQYQMKNFMAAIRLINEIALVAEDEGHHPDMHLTGYRKLSIELGTHAIGGLTGNDFILAAKISRLPKELKGLQK